MKRILVLFSLLILFSQTHSSENSAKKDKTLSEFMDLKFGMFVHWGPVSLRGTEIGWSRGREVTVEDYDNLYQEFNPVLFDADEWIKTLKDAGMKYFVITTRHHDGFSIWPSDFSDYDISATPYKKDVLTELKKACDKYEIMFGTYYSICDWKHPDYPLGSPGGKTQKESGDMEKYIPFIKAQTKELIEKYNTRILWFDGEWEKPWTHEMGLDFYHYLKGLDNTVLINNRVDKGRKGMEGVTISDEYAGDYATPEQRIGAYDVENPWESCITICNQWAWKPNDQMKSFDECIQTLIKTVGGGGNLLFNIGPMPDGRIEQRQKDRLKEMGDWLKVYGESIYETKGGPYKPTEKFASTRKGNKIYLHLFNWDASSVTVPAPGTDKIKSCGILKGEGLDFSQTANSLTVYIPASLKNQSVLTIEIGLVNNVLTIDTIEIN
ncbi:alpha-L-fucosidase [Prolixibacteraceae bacterium Z1-6]|uniref:alpha-L-fucosidase n=1 Tax=Draconibacterium aestuarii TaxID=2998507 RepID=A0A9X3FE28_9BACT|nr:alpha-L-fucosidase [Prolixibacteraceae bacterium Z1-6]